jgi:hypothetical protein
MADLAIRIVRLCGIVADLGLKRDCNHFFVSDLTLSVDLSGYGFTKLIKAYKVKDFEVERRGDFLHAKCTFRNVRWSATVWCRSTEPSEMAAWQCINDHSKPALEANLPRLAVKRVAIEDKRRPPGLPAPEVIDT